MTTQNSNQRKISLKGFWKLTLAGQRLIRWPAFSLTGLFVLLGVATVSSDITFSLYIGLNLFALMFHIFAYVLNDVIDLPVDRMNPDRKEYPLVKGTIQLWQALTLALVQIPLALLMTYILDGGLAAYLAAIVAFVMLTIYDVWGKVNFFPIITDVFQGIGWGALVIYGAHIATGSTTMQSWVTAMTVAMFVVIVNGIHGALRDVPTDLQAHRCTASILLGARPDNTGHLIIPRLLKAYGWVLLWVQLGLMLYLLLNLDYTWFMWSISFTTVLIFQSVGIWATHQMFEQKSQFSVEALAYVYWVISIICFIGVWLPQISWFFSLVLILNFLVPLVSYDYMYDYFVAWWQQQLAKFFIGIFYTQNNNERVK